MKRIISTEPVAIPDGHGGVRETIYVEVPAMQDEKTGEVFLEDDALGILDHAKAIRMGGYAVDISIRPLSKTRVARRNRNSSSRALAYA